MTVKCLITAGCSFSLPYAMDITWPIHLNDNLRPEKVYYLGQSAVGNGIISRRLVNAINEALSLYSPDEILVGVMWSGYSRRDLHSTMKYDCEPLNSGEYHTNPVSVINKKEHYIIHPIWTDDLSKQFTKYAYDDCDSLLITLEHILRIQWLLKLHNINYFMTEYDYDVFTDDRGNKLKLISCTEDLQFLFNQIDFSTWLPIENMYDYALNESSFDFARPPDTHPSTEQHKEMVEKVLLPFLKNKYNIE